MSYVKVKSIKISASTYSVVGASSNCIPLHYQQSQEFPLADMLKDFSGGMMQFATHTDKHARIDALVADYAKRVREATGLDPYDLPGHSTTVFDLLCRRQRWENNWRNGQYTDRAYVDQNIATIDKQIAVVENYGPVNAILAQFMLDVAAPPRNDKYLVKFGENYALRVNWPDYDRGRNGKATATRRRESAKVFGLDHARQVVATFGGEVVPA
jgi:hypothetical protein